MKEIKLTNSNLTTIIDDEDYPRVSKYKWRKDKDSRTNYFTVRGTVDNKNVYLHRFVLGLKNSKQVVDHIDRNTLNNQKSNLRLVTQRENVLNSNTKKESHISIRNKNNKWCVYDVINKKSLGTYLTCDEALLVRDKLLLELLGELCSQFTYDLNYIKNATYPKKINKGTYSKENFTGKENKKLQKYNRPSPLELHKLVWTKSTAKVAKDIGCSAKAIEKWCKLYKIKKPQKGFWQKIESNKLEGQSCPIC